MQRRSGRADPDDRDLKRSRTTSRSLLADADGATGQRQLQVAQSVVCTWHRTGDPASRSPPRGPGRHLEQNDDVGISSSLESPHRTGDLGCGGRLGGPRRRERRSRRRATANHGARRVVRHPDRTQAPARGGRQVALVPLVPLGRTELLWTRRRALRCECRSGGSPSWCDAADMLLTRELSASTCHPETPIASWFAHGSRTTPVRCHVAATGSGADDGRPSRGPLHGTSPPRSNARGVATTRSWVEVAKYSRS